MNATNLFASIPVADHDEAAPWYERLVGRPPDLIPSDNESCWQLREGAWIYIVGEPDRAGTALVTVLVEDLEGQLAELRKRGISTPPIEEIPNAALQAEITDPDGNRVKFAQPLSGEG